ncbi:Rieske 2Fe-2S domain-containing protein [Pseudomonas sp. LRF_L74]|uniref:Rieske 2Fe-2S domain-containing protein n=1 Tax=Pseudomonas sp. LRF_L74 TaxID=3369422 RepID=UPI003F5F9A3D
MKGWWPVALAHELKRDRPLGRTPHGLPVVLFRQANGAPAALPDRCPHRFAPLSAGRVRDGQVECPYHGWRFDGLGRCVRVPGSNEGAGAKSLLHGLACREEHGLIWVSRDAAGAPVGSAQVEDCDAFWMTSTVRCGLQEAAENFLDGFHTHFVHAGWIRRDTQRQMILAEVQALEDGVQARYSEEGKQSGLISRLFEGNRGLSFGRFRLPGLAEIEYRNRAGGLNLLVSAWLTPMADGELQVFARIATARGKLPAWVKRIALRRLFSVILRQDRRILEQVSDHQRYFQAAPADWGPSRMLDGRQDLLGPWIAQLLATGHMQDFAPYQVVIEL